MSADSTAPPTGSHQVGDRVALHGEVTAVYTGQDGPRVDVEFDAGFRLGFDPAYLAVVAGDAPGDAVKRAEGRIVAWLRSFPPAAGAKATLGILADAIDRGEHRAE